jgi:hypothetical protein
VATKFQCDVCGKFMDPGDHTHDVHFRSRKHENQERYALRPVVYPIGEMDGHIHVEVCEPCNDKIRKLVNELSATEKASASQASSGSKEA